MSPKSYREERKKESFPTKQQDKYNFQALDSFLEANDKLRRGPIQLRSKITEFKTFDDTEQRNVHGWLKREFAETFDGSNISNMSNMLTIPNSLQTYRFLSNSKK